MKLYIVTGASRGLGAALAEALIHPDHRLICLARSKAPLAALRRRGTASGCAIETAAVDIRDGEAAVAALAAALAALGAERFDAATLINNAGVVEPIGRVETLQPADIGAAIAVNLSAVVALTAAFLRLTDAWRAERKVLNISTGAAQKVYAGWSLYCATKAGLDHFSRCLALEQEGKRNGAKVVALAPGMIDTAMQEAVRRAKPADFAELPRFVALKESGQLPSPEDAARRVLHYLERADFGAKAVDDVRTA